MGRLKHTLVVQYETGGTAIPSLFSTWKKQPQTFISKGKKIPRLLQAEVLTPLEIQKKGGCCMYLIPFERWLEVLTRIIVLLYLVKRFVNRKY